MLNELRAYQQWIETELKKPINDALRTYHEQKIHEFQHERLTHLLVTLTVGIALLLSVFMTFILNQPMLYVIDGILFLLFIPYLLHYRGLENGIQRLYIITDKMFRNIF